METNSSVVSVHAHSHSTGWGTFIFGVFKPKQLTLEQRMDKAKERWRECRKLRLLLTSVTIARDEQESKLKQPYYGVVKADLEDPTITLKPFLIYPDTTLRTVIDSVAAVVVLYFCFVMSYRIGFFSDEENQKIRWYDLVCDGIMLVYAGMNFFMAYLEDIEVVDDRWQIALRYFRTSFFPDIIAVLPLYVLNANLLWLKLLRLIRVSLISLLLENFVEFLSNTLGRLIITWEVKIALNRILQFLFYLSLICHLIACGWHFLAIKEGVPLEQTWLQGVDMNNIEAYVASVYWVLVTFTTVGYGDIVPKTDYEIAYAMIVQFIGILFFAYLVGSMSQIASNMNKYEQALTKQENDLEKWLLMLDKNRPDKRLRPELHASIRAYFQYIWKNDHSRVIATSEFFMRLPNELRQELTRVLFSATVEKFRAFTYECDEDFGYSLVLHMYPRKFKKFEVIVAEGNLPTEMYFVDEGAITVTAYHGSVTCLAMQKGGFVGDYELVYRVPTVGTYQ